LLAPTAAVKYGGSELLCFPLGGDGSPLTPFPATLVFPYANRRPIQPLNGLIIIDGATLALFSVAASASPRSPPTILLQHQCFTLITPAASCCLVAKKPSTTDKILLFGDYFAEHKMSTINQVVVKYI